MEQIVPEADSDPALKRGLGDVRVMEKLQVTRSKVSPVDFIYSTFPEMGSI